MHSFVSTGSRGYGGSGLTPRRSRSSSIATNYSSLGKRSLELRRKSSSNSLFIEHRRGSAFPQRLLSALSQPPDMAAAVAASQGANTGGGNHEHHERSDKAALLEHEDPVLARTITVDESFRRMEELVGAEEEDKNWKGIVISLVVICSILALIVTAIAIITPRKEKFEPGSDLSFSQMTSQSFTPSDPIFQFSKDGKSYMAIVHNRTDGKTDEYLGLLDVNRTGNKPAKVLIPSLQHNTELSDLKSAALSPDGEHVLLEVLPAGQDKPSYIVYKVSTNGFVENSHFKRGEELDYVSWLGDQSAMIYIKDNTIIYKESPSSQPLSISPETDAGAIPTPLYKKLLGKDILLWTSPDETKIAFTQISAPPKELRRKRSTDTPESESSQQNVTVKVVDLKSPDTTKVLRAENVSSSRLVYLTGVSWAGDDHIMTVWLDHYHKVLTYLLCDVNTAVCKLNMEYRPAHEDLSWVDNIQTPVFSKDGSVYYTIIPDPSNPNTLYHHLVAVTTDKAIRGNPDMKFLTSHHWSDGSIVALRDSDLYYLSSGSNYTHRHLYRYNTTGQESKCLTCEQNLNTPCLYVDAEITESGEYALITCLGPEVKSHHILSLKSDKRTSIQVDKDNYRKLTEALASVNPPHSEFYEIQLGRSGFKAYVRVHIPAVLDRSKKYRYGLVIMMSDTLDSNRVTQVHPDIFTTYLGKNQSYLVADVDIRGSAGHGELLRQSVNGSLGVKEAYDIKQIVSYINEHSETFKVNETQIAVMGYGYGGFVALHALRKEVVPCGIAVGSVTDLNNLDDFTRMRYMGDDPLKISKTKLTYSCRKGDECFSPKRQHILLVHGIDDEVYKYSNSLEVMRKLQVAGFDFRQQIYPGVGHDIVNSPVYKHFYQTVTKYLAECFNGDMSHESLVNR